MIVICPACATRMAASVTVQLGARVGNRCVKCSHVWLPRNSVPDAAVGPAAQPSQLVAEAGRRARAKAAVARTAQARPVGLPGQLFQWMVLTLVTASLVMTILLWPRQIVSAFPAAAQLYHRIGIEVNVLGLTIDNVSSRLEYEDGQPVLRIDGLIGNLNDHPRKIPALTLTLRDASSEAIFTWSAEVADIPLPTRSRVAFTTSVAAPPEAAEQVEIRFGRGEESTSAHVR